MKLYAMHLVIMNHEQESKSVGGKKRNLQFIRRNSKWSERPPSLWTLKSWNEKHVQG